MCETCTALLNEALNLTVRGRTLDGIRRRADTLAASKDPDGWQEDGLFDRHVARHNCTCQPWNAIETRSLTPQLWAEDQFQRDLHDWKMRARKHIMQDCGASCADRDGKSMTTEARQPVICASCGWTGKRMTGTTHTCPKCGAFVVFIFPAAPPRS